MESEKPCLSFGSQINLTCSDYYATEGLLQCVSPTFKKTDLKAD